MGTYCIEHWTRSTVPEKAITLFDYRKDGPDTSKAGAADVNLRKDSQQALLLKAWALQEHWTDGLTDEEAGEISGLANRRRCAYWTRCSELRRMGLIEDTGTTRVASSGSHQMVSRITKLGMHAVGRLR